MAGKKAKHTVHKQAQHAPQASNAPKAGTTKADGNKRSFSLTVKLAIVLAIISLSVYANTLRNGYVLDDSSAISENTIVMKGTAAIPELLSTPYRRGYAISSNDLYRPLSLVMLATEYQFFGLNPMPNHMVNIFLFAACVVMLFLFLDRFFEHKKTAVSFIASLLFAVHPIHTEVVANIKSQDELLCFFFAFLSLNLFLKYMEAGKTTQLLAGAAGFFLALLSKETVGTFLVIIPLLFFFFRNENKRRAMYITGSAVAMVVIFLAIRLSVLNAYDANHITNILVADNALADAHLPVESRLATAILILGKYLQLLFVPWPLICDYSYSTIPYAHFSNIKVVISLVIYLALAFYGIRGLVKKSKSPYVFAVLFFLVTISLFSNIPFLIGATMGERFMFFGSVGFCLAIALLIEQRVGITTNATLVVLKQPKVLGILIPVTVLFSVITFGRNKDWHDNYTLYKTDIAKAPNSSRLNYFLGLELETTVAMKEPDSAKQRVERNEGIAYLEKSLAIEPECADAQATLGNSYLFLGQYDSAELHERKALDLYPLGYKTASNLAYIYYKEKRYQQSVDMSRTAIGLNPDYVNPYTNMGRCYLNLGKNDSAVYILHKAIGVDATNIYPYAVLAYYYSSVGQQDSAARYTALSKKYGG